MSYKYLILEKEEKIAKITMNNPKALNALNSETLEELNIVLDEIEKDDKIHVLVITGNGKAFIAGADIKEMAQKDVKQASDFAKFGMSVFMKIEKLSKPVIAAINGYALGGGLELALSCDIRIASENAVFGQPEVGLGITPGFGATQRLPRVVGIAKAKQIIFTGKNLKSKEAYDIGLVNEIYSDDELMEKVLEMAKKIASNGKLAVSYAKEAINFGLQTDIQTSMEIEKNSFAKCFASEDQKEAMKAFMEKRKYEFQGK